MTDLVDPDTIEQIVGRQRHATEHWARNHSEAKKVFILHSQECVDSGVDLRECPFSLALDDGIALDDWDAYGDTPVQVEIREGDFTPAYLDIPEEERFKPGTRVKASGRVLFDVNNGQEYIVEAYVDKDERDHPMPYYMVATIDDGLGGYCVPHQSLTKVMSPEEHAESMKLPETEEVAKWLSSALHSAFGDDGIEVHESRVLKESSTGEWPEVEHDFTYGVEFYGKTSGGRRFGAVVRITALYETDY